MTAAAQIAEMVQATIGALARLEAEELEALEGRLLDLADHKSERFHANTSLRSDLELVARTELLGRCLKMTAQNLQVLERLASSRMETASLAERKEKV